jgi:phosphotriesterase-related protein
MAEISTLLGGVLPEDLGIVSLNEHLLFGLHGWQFAPEVNFNRAMAFERLCSSLDRFRRSGGGTIVDTSGITLGRDVTFYSKLSQLTGVKIIAATGFDNEPMSILQHFTFFGTFYRPPTPFEPEFKRYSGSIWEREIPGHFYPSHGATKEYRILLLYNEVSRGMVAPGMIRTKMKAGIVKSGNSWGQITFEEEYWLRAAAVAAKRTGLAVITNGVNQARRQLEILFEEGLEANRIVIGHCDDGRALDLKRDQEFAKKGVYVAYDHIGWEDSSFPHSIPDERRAEVVKAMVQAGLTDRIILSCGTIGYALGVPQPSHSFSHLLESFVPRLTKAGISSTSIEMILRENPKRILTTQKGRGVE